MNRLTHFFVLLLIVFAGLLSVSCQATHSFYRTPSEQATALLQEGIKNNDTLAQARARQTIPNPIKSALIPGAGSLQNSPQNIKLTNIYEKRFNINVSNVPAALFFKNVGKEVPYSIVIDPKISGSITINLKNASIIDLLNALRDTYGYDYRHTDFGFEVLPAKLETRAFHVNYLDVARQATSNTQITTDSLASGLQQQTNNTTNGIPSSGSSAASNTSAETTRSQVNTTSLINFWAELELSLKSLVGTDQGKSVLVNSASGTIVVRGYPSDIRSVSDFLDRIQSNMTREVILEVKLLEVQLNDSYAAGIDWNVFGFQQGDPTNAPIGGLLPTGISPLTTINIHGNNFQNIIQLLELQGNVQTIANPRVLAVNNQQAVIRIGTDQFFVTGITDNISNNSTGNTVTSASVNLAPFFSGVVPDITPQISQDGEILLHLHPVVSDVTEQQQKIDIGASTPMILPVAVNNVREYDSIVRARNQQVVLVGGLTQNNLSENMNNTPFLSKIPFLGMLFRATYQNSQKTELVILLKPTIIGQANEGMARQLPIAESRINELDRGFHQGGLIEQFGNEAEHPFYNNEMGQ